MERQRDYHFPQARGLRQSAEIPISIPPKQQIPRPLRDKRIILPIDARYGFTSCYLLVISEQIQLKILGAQ